MHHHSIHPGMMVLIFNKNGSPVYHIQVFHSNKLLQYLPGSKRGYSRRRQNGVKETQQGALTVVCHLFTILPASIIQFYYEDWEATMLVMIHRAIKPGNNNIMTALRRPTKEPCRPVHGMKYPEPAYTCGTSRCWKHN